ncbi:MAG: Efflux transporter, family, subunit [Pedosphaera sp.]|nr:Efflux transporter, family, subunit [Pedosphaera sp.]
MTDQELLQRRETENGSQLAGPRLQPDQPRPHWGLRIFLIALLCGVAVLAGIWVTKHRAAAAAKLAATARMGPPVVPVVPGTALQKDVPIYLDGLGNVQAFNMVTVKAQIDGQLKQVAFVEGQDVHKGDLLAKIDQAPYQAALQQAMAKKRQDEAQLSNGKINLTRELNLVAAKIDPQQTLDAQQALVDQLAATVEADQAAIESAQVQLAYTTINSPIDGRTGIRQVDGGNIVHANDPFGLVVITQVQPITVVFTLPEQTLGEIRDHAVPEGLTVYAVDRDNSTVLAEGKLAVIDNQIDITTGTIKIKATFANENLKLWPGQFVNARLLLTVRKNGIVVPATAVQRGPDGAFVFVIEPGKSDKDGKDTLKVKTQPVKVAQIEAGQALIDSGLQPGERIVVDGQYKLQEGSQVKLSPPSNTANTGSGAAETAP